MAIRGSVFWEPEPKIENLYNNHGNPDPKGREMVQLRTLKAKMALEVNGMAQHGQSATQIVRQRYGIKKRRKIDVYFEFCRLTNQEPSRQMQEKKSQMNGKHRKDKQNDNRPDA
jgi:hypothetical protein